ncbi:MAG: CtsR family transcriptional regulator [Peptococcaceae bacterium]|jgi:transcriptional regulator CtsR|nr:CtsR family transcriptional regulator [Peptococcaceae bacterium]MDH7526132.1 CtsR family transcriptional regulator [Peptococcaceae bacterium]
MSLSQRIENYIKRLLEQHNFVEIQRSELAEVFRCVPSQINYVLSTRFTPAQGYLVESRRGGGGYLRIVKLSWSSNDSTIQDIFENIGLEIDQWEAEGLLKRLKEEQIITAREYHILRAAIDRNTLQLELPERDIIRSRILQAALAALSRNDL